MPPDDVVEDLANVLVGVERAEHGIDGVRADLVPALDQLDELVDHLARLGDVRVVPVERELVPAQPDGALQPVAKRFEHAVVRAGHPGQLGGDFVGDVEDFLHAKQCRRACRSGGLRSEPGDASGPARP